MVPPPGLDTKRRALDEHAGESVLERRAEIAKHAQLSENDRSGRIAVEALDLAVGQLKNVTARCIHPLPGRAQCPGRQAQWPQVGSLESELDNHDVASDIHLIQLAVHVGKRAGVVLNRYRKLVRAAVGSASGLVGKDSVLGEGCYPALDVFVLGDLVGPPDDLFTVQSDITRHGISLRRWPDPAAMLPR